MNRRIIAAVLALGVGAGAWWLAPTGEQTRPPELTASPAVRLAEVRLPDLDDRERSMSEWAGRPLLINFWATWCAPCRREMPRLQRLADAQPAGGLQVIGIALDTREDAERFVTEYGIRYPVLYGEHAGAVFAESFGDAFVALPFSVFVAASGEVVALKSGELQDVELDDLARRSAAGP